MIYFIRETGTLLVKIGVVRQHDGLKARLKTLQIGNPRILTVEATCPGLFPEERAFHSLFREKRVPHGNEWFELDATTVASVGDMAPSIIAIAAEAKVKAKAKRAEERKRSKAKAEAEAEAKAKAKASAEAEAEVKAGAWAKARGASVAVTNVANVSTRLVKLYAERDKAIAANPPDANNYMAATGRSLIEREIGKIVALRDECIAIADGDTGDTTQEIADRHAEICEIFDRCECTIMAAIYEQDTDSHAVFQKRKEHEERWAQWARTVRATNRADRLSDSVCSACESPLLRGSCWYVSQEDDAYHLTQGDARHLDEWLARGGDALLLPCCSRNCARKTLATRSRPGEGISAPLPGSEFRFLCKYLETLSDDALARGLGVVFDDKR